MCVCVCVCVYFIPPPFSTLPRVERGGGIKYFWGKMIVTHILTYSEHKLVR